MTKWQKMNLIVFAVVIVSLASLVYVLGTDNMSNPFGKPWHLQPSVHEDSLSQKYLNGYQILDHGPLLKHYFDSTRINVFVLVDAWGIPVNESVLESELEPFDQISHKFALHQRLANRTRHAEHVEFRNSVQNNIYLFGGDSSEYNRPDYISEIGFGRTMYCRNCNDEIMVAKIDSLLDADSLQLIAWTTQSSRSGDKDSLYKSLKLIADFALRHPDVQIVVQGTHRPILCNSEVRNAYKSHWVPVVILNGKIQ